MTEPAIVTITLGSTSCTLRPTVDRMRVLNRLAGGFVPLFRAVTTSDGDTMALIVAASGGTRGKAVEDLARAVWAAGLENLVDPLTGFLTLCTNGGRDPEAARARPAEGQSTAPDPSPAGGLDAGTSDQGTGADAGGDAGLPAGAQLLDAVRDAGKRYGTGGLPHGGANPEAAADAEITP